MRHRSSRFHYSGRGAFSWIIIQMEMSCPVKHFSPEHLECVAKCRVKDHHTESDLCHPAASGCWSRAAGSLEKCQSLHFTAVFFFFFSEECLSYSSGDRLCFGTVNAPLHLSNFTNTHSSGLTGPSQKSASLWWWCVSLRATQNCNFLPKNQLWRTVTNS